MRLKYSYPLLKVNYVWCWIEVPELCFQSSLWEVFPCPVLPQGDLMHTIGLMKRACPGLWGNFCLHKCANLNDNGSNMTTCFCVIWYCSVSFWFLLQFFIILFLILLGMLNLCFYISKLHVQTRFLYLLGNFGLNKYANLHNVNGSQFLFSVEG